MNVLVKNFFTLNCSLEFKVCVSENLRMDLEIASSPREGNSDFTVPGMVAFSGNFLYVSRYLKVFTV